MRLSLISRTLGDCYDVVSRALSATIVPSYSKFTRIYSHYMPPLREINVKKFKKMIIGTVAASFTSLSIHIFFVNRVQPILTSSMQRIVIPQPPYSTFINTMAYATALIPTFSMNYIYYKAGDKIPFESRLSKGLTLGTLKLLVTGSLIRAPLMNWIVGMPIRLVLLQQSQTWITAFVTGIITSYTIDPLSKDGKKLS